MKNAVSGGSLPYDIYTTSGRTQRWGMTQGTDTVAGSANAAGVATLTAYGRIAASATSVAAGLYTDTVTVTVYRGKKQLDVKVTLGDAKDTVPGQQT